MSVDLCYTPATELAERVRTGELSPVELVDAYLDRIDARNDVTNAFVTVIEEAARERAKEAEQAVESGDELGPLHGVPVALKDLFGRKAGVRNTFGSKLFAEHVPEEDAIMVRRLEDAGAIVLGKTNTPEFGYAGTTDNPLFGATGTPFDPTKTAGGSSGGSAAALADGLTPLAQGSDAGGSLRIPASACGLFGLKTTLGRIPHAPRPNGFAHHTPATTMGPFARTVEDAALMLDVCAGPDPRDPFSLPAAETDYVAATERPVDDLRVAYSPDLSRFRIAEDVRTVITEGVDALAEAGATVEKSEVGGPSLGELRFAFTKLYTVGFATLAATVEEQYGLDPLGEHREAVTPDLVQMMEIGKSFDVAEYGTANVPRTGLHDAMEDLFAEYDLLVTPTLAVPPFGIDEPEPTQIDGEPINSLTDWLLTWPFNLTGHPAASVPAGLTEEGLPVGMQVVGPRFAEDDVLAASAAVERVRPWAEEYPRADG
jgi:Asp-tRNA(Asn)/Glu-tRNA(Gln) amidotransferase A subunit family amidase